jgi:hypothetical protein
MAQASRKLRRERRLKREKSLAFRALGQAIRERNAWKELAEKIAIQSFKAEQETKPEPALTITKVEDETETIDYHDAVEQVVGIPQE